MTDISKTVENLGKSLSVQRQNIVRVVRELLNLCIKAAGGEPLVVYTEVAREVGRYCVEVTINDFTFIHHFSRNNHDRIHQTIRFMDGENVEIKYLIEDTDTIPPELRKSILDLRQEISHACVALTEKQKCSTAWEPFIIHTASERINERKKPATKPAPVESRMPDDPRYQPHYVTDAGYTNRDV